MKNFRVLVAFATALCVSVVVADYKPNGPPLHVSAGAVPFEPNTDKLKHKYNNFSQHKGTEPLVVIALTKADWEKGLKLFDPKAKAKYNEDSIYVFYFYGEVPKTEGRTGLPSTMSLQIFGVERLYITNIVNPNGPNLTLDSVTFHLVAKDINRPMPAHSPACLYQIKKSDLDTEYEKGTPPITKITQFNHLEHRCLLRFNYKPQKKE